MVFGVYTGAFLVYLAAFGFLLAAQNTFRATQRICDDNIATLKKALALHNCGAREEAVQVLDSVTRLPSTGGDA